jgi:hypothetical protein
MWFNYTEANLENNPAPNQMIKHQQGIAWAVWGGYNIFP